MAVGSGPIGSAPISSGPISAPGAPGLSPPIAVTNQSLSWAALIDTVAVFGASGTLAYREIETLAGTAAGASATVDPVLGMQVMSRQLDELLSLAQQVLIALRLRRSGAR